jgi:hypothetical protein
VVRQKYRAIGGLITGAFVLFLAVAGPILLVLTGFLLVVAGWLPLLLMIGAGFYELGARCVVTARRRSGW